MASFQTGEREFGAFAALRDDYPKTVPSLAEFPQSRDGIQSVNIVELPLECKAFDEARGFNG